MRIRIVWVDYDRVKEGMWRSRNVMRMLRWRQTSFWLVEVLRLNILVFFWTWLLNIWFTNNLISLLNFNFIFADEVENFFSFVPTAVSLALRLAFWSSFFLVWFPKKADLFEHDFKRRWINFDIFFRDGQIAQNFTFETLIRMDKYFGQAC